ASAPSKANRAAKSNAAGHPADFAIRGVRVGANVPPILVPIIVRPVTVAADSPAISAIVDQKAVIEAKRHPLPSESVAIATYGLAALAPQKIMTAATNSIPKAVPFRPIRLP